MTTTRSLTDAEYDIADVICQYLDGRPVTETFTASQLARVAKVSTNAAYPVLAHLVAQSEVGVAGRGGAWIRYRAHQHGEVNR